MTKNACVFQSVSRNWRVASSIPSTDTRLVTHGEPDASEALRLRIRRELHWNAHVPDFRETVDLAAP